MDTFSYLGDMLSAGSGMEEAVRCRVIFAWGKFSELMLILTMRRTSLIKGKGEDLHSLCAGCDNIW